MSQPFNIDPRWEISTVLFHCVKIVDCKIVVKLGYSSICQHIELFLMSVIFLELNSNQMKRQLKFNRTAFPFPKI